MKTPDIYRLKKGELVTSNEVCRLFRISRRTLYRLIKKGDMLAITVGGTYRFRAADLRAYFESKASHAPQPLYFKPELLEKYLNQPDEYRIRPVKGGGAWIEITKLYQATLGRGRAEGLIRYHERRWPASPNAFGGPGEEKVILLTQAQFRHLPLEEQMHFRRFEIP